MLVIEKLTEASEQTLDDINRLLPQLSKSVSDHASSLKSLQEIIHNTNAALIVARDDGHVIGIAALYIITKLTKRSAFVEDVVVDSAYRGQGLGEKIMRELIDRARAAGVNSLSLTSRAERVAGNKLYQKLGFEQKETNVYTMKLSAPSA